MKFCTLLWKKTATQKIFCIAVISKMHSKLRCDTRKIIPWWYSSAELEQDGVLWPAMLLFFWLVFVCFFLLCLLAHELFGGCDPSLSSKLWIQDCSASNTKIPVFTHTHTKKKGFLKEKKQHSFPKNHVSIN